MSDGFIYILTLAEITSKYNNTLTKKKITNLKVIIPIYKKKINQIPLVCSP